MHKTVRNVLKFRVLTRFTGRQYRDFMNLISDKQCNPLENDGIK